MVRRHAEDRIQLPRDMSNMKAACPIYMSRVTYDGIM